MQFKLFSVKRRGSSMSQTSAIVQTHDHPPAVRSRYPWETSDAGEYLDSLWSIYSKHPTCYNRIAEILDKAFTHSDLTVSEVQDLSFLLRDKLHLLLRFTKVCPNGPDIQPSDDFKRTGLVKVIGKDHTFWCAAFGLSDPPFIHLSKEMYLSLLRNSLVHKEHEEAVITLRGEHAQRMLGLIQKLLDDPTMWKGFVDRARRENSPPLDEKKWKRMRRLLVKLANVSLELPPEICVDDNITRDLDWRTGGANSDVYVGKYKSHDVALKRLKGTVGLSKAASHDLIQAVYEEALIWRQLKHDHIITIYGINKTLFAGSEASHCIVMPWMKSGNIRQHIGSLIERNQDYSVPQWLIQIARGLQYLHDQGVVHGDLRGANILIDDQGKVRLTDFGLSVLIRTRTSSKAIGIPVGGTARWMAPELYVSLNILVGNRDSFEPSVEFWPPTAVDIYAFACTCVELYSRDEPVFAIDPLPERVHNRLIESEVSNRRRPIRPHEMGDPLWQLIQRYWDQDYTRRPSAEQVVEELSSLFP